MKSRKRWVYPLLIAALGLIVYSNTLTAPFQWDDKYAFLSENPIIKDLGYFVAPSKAEELQLYGALKSRYVGYLTFALNYRVHGLDVRGYHAVNIAIHLLNALLVYYFVVLTFRTPFIAASPVLLRPVAGRGGPCPPSRRGPCPLLKDDYREIALFTGLLFVSHPVQTEAVTYIFQRFASLVTFFYLGSIVLYIKWRGSQTPFKPALYALSLMSAFLAMKTKENAFALPFVIALYELSFFQGRLGRRLLRLAPFFLSLLLIAHIFVGVFDAPVEDMIEQMEEGPAGYRGISREDYVFTEFRVVVTYLRLLFFPVGQNIDYDYPVFHSPLDGQVLLSIIFLTLMSGYALYTLFSSRNPGLRLISIGILWFFLALYVESGTVALPMVINEYRLYMPSSGAFMSMVAAAFMLFRGKRFRKPLIALLVLITAVFSAASFARNRVWHSEISLWEDAVGKSPGKARPHNNLGLAYMSGGMPDRAIAEYLTAIKINPYYWQAHNNVASAYSEKGDADGAIRHYARAARIKPDSARVHFNLANAYDRAGRHEMALYHYKLAMSFDPGFSEAACNLGSTYANKGLTDKAIEQYLFALTLDPNNATAYNNLGTLYMGRGDFYEALKQYKNALMLQPDFAEAHFNIAVAYDKKGMAAPAMEHYVAAIKANPRHAKAHNNAGIIYLYGGNSDRAAEHFLKAVEIEPDYALAHNNLGLAYETLGRTDLSIRHYLTAVGLKPDLAEAYRNLGIAYAKQGYNDKAKEYFRKFKEIEAE